MQQIARAVTQAFNNLPRPHRVMLGSLSVLTLAVAVWRPYIYHPESAPIVRTIELEKSEIRSLLLRPQRDGSGEGLYALPNGASVPRLL